jgi:hypothetical protein
MFKPFLGLSIMGEEQMEETGRLGSLSSWTPTPERGIILSSGNGGDMKESRIIRIFPVRKKEKVTGFSIPLKGTGVPAIIFLSLFLVFAAPERSLTADVDFLAKMGVTRVENSVDAPDFTLPDLQGEKRSLEEFRGKFVMLNFWATW